MGDIIKELSNIGRLISESTLIEAFNNYKLKDEQVYCIDISKQLEILPKQNANPQKYIVSRFKESASNAGNLYPSIKRNKKDHAKSATKLYEYARNFLDYCPTIYNCFNDEAYLALKQFIKNEKTTTVQELINKCLKIPSNDGKEYAGSKPFCFFLTYNQKSYSELYPGLLIGRINNSAIATNLFKFNMLETQKQTHALAVFFEPNFSISISTILDVSDRSFVVERSTTHEEENLQMIFPSAKIAKNKKKILIALEEINEKVQNLKKIFKKNLTNSIDNQLNRFLKLDDQQLEKIATNISKGLKDIQVKYPIYLYLTIKYQPIAFYNSQLFAYSIYGESDLNNVNGEDFLSKEKIIGGDPQLSFMSFNELPKAMQTQKIYKLPLSNNNAIYVKKGFQFFDKAMSFTLYYPLTKTNLKIGVLPTVLTKQKELEIDEIYQSIYNEYNVIQNRHAKNAKDMEETEESIIYSMLPELEDLSEFEKNLPVMNTIIIYEQSSQKRTMHLTIPDVLPSYLLRQSQLLREFSLILFPIKDRKEPKLSELFQDYIETFEVMFSDKKLATDRLVGKLTKAMLFGTARSNAVDEQYYPFINFIRLCGSKSEYNYERTIRDPDMIVNIVTFFNKMEKTTQKLNLRKEMEDGMAWKLNDTDSFESAVDQYLKQTVFIHDEKSLQVMYLLGMLSAALIKWQLGVMKGTSSFGKWLNNLGQINEKNIVRIFEKFDEGYRKTKQTASGFDNCKIEVLLTHYANAYREDKNIGQKSNDKATMAFIFGMSDYKNIVKAQRTCNGRVAQEDHEEETQQGEE